MVFFVSRYELFFLERYKVVYDNNFSIRYKRIQKDIIIVTEVSKFYGVNIIEMSINVKYFNKHANVYLKKNGHYWDQFNNSCQKRQTKTT